MLCCAVLCSCTPAKTAKPDMQAYSKVKETARMGIYGHIPGVALGQQYEGRGLLAALGLHNQIMKGIDRPAK